MSNSSVEKKPVLIRFLLASIVINDAHIRSDIGMPIVLWQV
jgi:hypothetical protein